MFLLVMQLIFFKDGGFVPSDIDKIAGTIGFLFN